MRVGISVNCAVCGLSKCPRGRSSPVGCRMCYSDCIGYDLDPKVGDLWPGETEEDFGYPVRTWGTREIVDKAVKNG